MQTGIYKLKLKNFYNPYKKGTTNPFLFETMEPGVNTVIE